MPEVACPNPSCDYKPPGIEVIKPEFILRLKIKHSEWLLADTCPQAANHWALFYNLQAAIVAVLITAHSMAHPPVAAAPVAHAPVSVTKIERVRRPTISAARTSTDWSHFLSRWKDYVNATKVDGRDRVI